MHVSVHGLGTVGLPLAAALCEHGEIVGVEVSASRRAHVLHRSGLLDEPGLREAVNRALDRHRLHVVAHPVPAHTHVICVPTPVRDELADLGLLIAAVAALRPLLRAGDRVFLESTVPVGALEELAEPSPDVLWAAAPERILPGNALDELRRVPRIVGGLTPRATAAAAAFYRETLGVEVHETDSRTAVATKLAENAARDVQIALANELDLLATAAGADPVAMRQLVATHPRVRLLEPGIGVGGHCLPVDPWFLVQADPDAAILLPAARRVNERATDRALDAIRQRADALENPRIALFGLAYKPAVGDVRNSPALAIAHALRDEGRDVVAADPHVSNPHGLTRATAVEAAAGADLAVFLVAHPEFRSLELSCAELDLCGARR